VIKLLNVQKSKTRINIQTRQNTPEDQGENRILALGKQGGFKEVLLIVLLFFNL